MQRKWSILAWATLASAAWGQGGASVPPVREFNLPPRIGIIGNRPLSLEETLTMALANNKDIDVSRIDKERAGYDITSAEGVFDPRIGAIVSWSKNVVPIASALGGSATGAVTNKNGTVDPTLTGQVPGIGSSYSLDFSNARSTTDNTFITLNPQYPTSLNLSYTQPLWRGLRYDQNRRTIDVAKKNQSLTDEQFRQRVMEIVTQAEQAYWDLAFAYGFLEVQVEAVQIAREQDASNRRQVEQGLLAPIDVVAAQTQMATFELSAYTAQQTLTTAENALKQLILAERSDPLWSVAIVPSTPVNLSPPIIPLSDAIQEALATRPELVQIRITSDINKLNHRFFNEQTKPQVDAVLLHSNAGLAGTAVPSTPNPFTSGLVALTNQVNELSTIAGVDPLPPVNGGGGGGVPPVLIGGYPDSLSNLFAGRFPTTQVQLRFSLPLRNRTAEANLASNLAEGRRIRDLQQQAELAVEASVRNSMQAVEMSKLRLDAARVARVSAEEQYESEQRQFRAGTSTLFLVQQRQNDMITARSQERLSESALGKAIAAFDLATGRTLTVRNINIR